MRSKYYFYEKVKDKYLIQNRETLELELVKETEYKEGVNLGLILDWSKKLLAVMTEKLILGVNYLAFETDKYAIKGYMDVLRNNDIYYEIVPKVNTIECIDKDVIIYIPKLIKRFRFSFSNIYIRRLVFIANNDFEHLSFWGCKAKEIDCRYINCKSLINCAEMFKDCNEVITINLNGWNIRYITDFRWMFHNCYKLKYLDLSIFDELTYELLLDGMFDGCSSLENVKCKNKKILTAFADRLVTQYKGVI